MDHSADVVEVRMPLDDDLRLIYATSEPREKYRVAAENPRKMHVLDKLLEKHADNEC